VKALRFFVALILMAGGCLTGRAAYLHAKARFAGILIRRAWEQSTQSGEPRAPWPWADTHPIAQLRIPRLDYDEIVLDGATPRTLAFGPALLMSGAAVGKPGNVVLAGHRTSWFRPLEKIVQGDRIQIAWFDTRRRGVYERTYAVDLIQVAEPQDVTLLAPTSEDALTLVTCYPFGSSPHSPLRYMVRASPIGPSRPAERSTAGAKSHQPTTQVAGYPPPKRKSLKLEVAVGPTIFTRMGIRVTGSEAFLKINASLSCPESRFSIVGSEEAHR
jgi:sortase A